MILLVGEAPAPSDGPLAPGEALTGSSGRRIASLAGLAWDDYLALTERVNLFDELPPIWLPYEAREAARLIIPRMYDRRTILLGQKVAAAFGLAGGEAMLEWATRWTSDIAGAEVAIVPHPSGRNRWWNDRANVARASTFLTTAINPLYKSVT